LNSMLQSTLFANGQSDSGTLELFSPVQPLENYEDPLKVLRLNSQTIVLPPLAVSERERVVSLAASIRIGSSNFWVSRGSNRCLVVRQRIRQAKAGDFIGR
jgi:hypothetical protein